MLRNWTLKSKDFGIEVELNSYIERAGYSIAEIPISYRTRIGEKKLKVKYGTTIQKSILEESILDTSILESPIA